MILQIELTPDQLDTLAEVVAAKLGQAAPRTKDALTVAEAARRLGVGRNTVYRHVEAGTIPKVPNLGVVRIPASYFDRVLHEESAASLA